MTPFKFYLLTDTHYFEPSLGAEGKAFESYMKREQFFLKESSQIVKATFEKIAEDKETDIVLIAGDLSKNGEKESHLSFIKELYKLSKKGKKIYVITAGHDYNEFSYCYKNDERYEVEGTSFDELYEMYYDFGLSEALSVHKRTHSYIAEIAPGVRLLALNCDSSDDVKGVFADDMLSWIKEQTDKAKEDGAFVFAICHYPIIPGVPVFDLVGDTKVKEWRRVASFLADEGVEIAFTGHMHIQSVNEFTSEKGNRFIDVCTAALVGSPARYRRVTVSEEGVMNIESIQTAEFRENTDVPLQKFFDDKFNEAILERVLGALSGGEGAVGAIKKKAKGFVENGTVGSLSRLLAIKTDKELKEKKLTDLIGEIGLAIFKGDMPYTEGTPVGDTFLRLLKRFSFVIGKVERKLSKDGNRVDLKEMLLGTIGYNKRYGDNFAEIELFKS